MVTVSVFFHKSHCIYYMISDVFEFEALSSVKALSPGTWLYKFTPTHSHPHSHLHKHVVYCVHTSFIRHLVDSVCYKSYGRIHNLPQLESPGSPASDIDCWTAAFWRNWLNPLWRLWLASAVTSHKFTLCNSRTHIYLKHQRTHTHTHTPKHKFLALSCAINVAAIGPLSHCLSLTGELLLHWPDKRTETPQRADLQIDKSIS